MHYLVTVSGDDQKGLVESLATAIESLGGNWLQSRLCRLEGQFAGIVTVAFDAEPKELPETVKTLQCNWRRMPSGEAPEGQSQSATIKILAADRPGIVKQISHVLAGNGANVEEVESRVVSAPFSGELMFEALYRISVDGSVDQHSLRRGLESLAEELMCDLQYQES